MDKFEKIEELKRRMLSTMVYRDDIPEEVISIIRTMFNSLANKYEEMNCNSLAIQEYIEGSFDEVIAYATNNIGKTRKEGQMQEVLYFVKGIQKEAEAVIEEENNNTKKYEPKIQQMEMGTYKASGKIVEAVEDALKSVQQRQNGILSSRGDSDDRIEQVYVETHDFINYLVRKNEERIFEAIQRDDNSAKQQLIDAYEDYLVQTRSEEKESSKREEFKKGLDADISLKDQNEFATGITEQNRNKKEPENLLSEDLLL